MSAVAEVVLFHHVQGLTPGVVSFAERLRRAGHIVHTPDLFTGETFANIDDGLAHARKIGFERVMRNAVEAVEGLPTAVVYGGFSMGVMPAQRFAQTRAGARGALLFHAAVAPEEFGAWPAGVPVQIHSMEDDPYFDDGDREAAKAIVAQAERGELFLYPGAEHLFADDSLPAYDAKAAALLLERVLAFLG